MSKFFNKDLADLAHQLTLSPRRLRVDQLRAIETLLMTVDPAKTYPYEFVCYHITKYRHRDREPRASIPGKALVADLVTIAESLSRSSKLTLAELGEPALVHQEVAEALNVSTKTVRRWRSRGLMGLRAIFPDGVSRLVFMRTTIDRFRTQHQALVAKGASFRQLTRTERNAIIERARKLVADRPLKLHAVARIIAEETGRAVETIRYTLRRFDAASKSAPLFSTDHSPRHDERALAMWNCRERGESVESIARAMACKTDEVEQSLRTVQVQRWRHSPPEFIAHESFEAPHADATILEAPEPAVPEPSSPRIPKDLPPYLQALYHTPLLSRELEADLFRRYNYLKFKAARLLKKVDPATVTVAEHDEISGLLRAVELVRQRIIAANLRLVVSIAKRHVGRSNNFFEIVSDGNMSLMRAVEKFDFSRGNKFSTYATWAITKNYARSIPEQYYRSSRMVTGQDVTLDTTADLSEVPAHSSDREHVRQVIEAGLQELSEREREVLRGHFGLGSSTLPATLEQLGERLGVTKERVRQIEQKALDRLRELLSPSLVDAV